MRLAALPKTEDGAGGTVFWTTGAVLLKYGEDKEQAAQYMDKLTHDQRIWEHSIKGNLPEEPAVGQLPVYMTIWDEYEANRPDWMTDWAFAIKDGLGAAQAIAPTILAIQQFDLAAPFYSAYLRGEESDAKTALTKAMDAVRPSTRRPARNRGLLGAEHELVAFHSARRNTPSIPAPHRSAGVSAAALKRILMAQLSARPAATHGATRSTTQRIGDWLARYGVPWLFLLPTIVFFVGWAIYPIVRVAWFSFLDYRPMQAARPVTFIGLQNYAAAFPIR